MMMIQLGNFFFKYRNTLFIPLYLALFIPSPEIITLPYHLPLLISGLSITFFGQAIRAATIGLAYIERGGRDKKVYASRLVTEGIFRHCRNPLYVGNILMLLGVGILSNSLFYVGLIVPAFLFIYHAIVLAEEHFLRNTFGAEFDAYCHQVNRWFPNFNGLKTTFHSMTFNWRRWLVKEYTTLFIWLLGITLILLFKYPELTFHETALRNDWLKLTVPCLIVAFLSVRYLKKSGKLVG